MWWDTKTRQGYHHLLATTKIHATSVNQGKIVYKHHAYTVSHYSNCVQKPTRAPYDRRYRNTHVGLDHNLIYNTYMLRIDHNNTKTSIILHKVETK